MPMSSVIPKERQTAYQRWEMTSFNEATRLENTAVEPQSVSDSELQAIREAARSEAYRAAYEDAYQRAYQEGRQQGELELQANASQVLQVLDQLQTSMHQQMQIAHQELGKEFVTLALQFADMLAQTQLGIHPELIIPIVEQAIQSLPAIKQPARLLLHPDDLKLVEELRGTQWQNEGWRIQTDPHLQRGACRIETASHLLDASYETRKEEIQRQLQVTLTQQSSP